VNVLAKLRKIVSSLPDVTEGAHAGAIAFKAGGAMFATYRATRDDAEIVFALEPDHMDALLATDPRFERYARAPALVIRASSIDDWKLLADLLRESYELVAAKRKPKAKAAKAPRRSGRRRASPSP
jgi:predicted DNA-binding protein (MmcQ/YjbR family)